MCDLLVGQLATEVEFKRYHLATTKARDLFFPKPPHLSMYI